MAAAGQAAVPAGDPVAAGRIAARARLLPQLPLASVRTVFRWGRKKGSDKAERARDDAGREGAEAPGGQGAASHDADAVRAPGGAPAGACMRRVAAEPEV